MHFYGTFYVEREDEHRLLAELLAVTWPSIKYISAVFDTTYLVLSVFPPFLLLWRLLEGVKMSKSAQVSSIFWSFVAVWTLRWLGKKNPFYHRFVSLRVLSILRVMGDINMAVRDREKNITKAMISNLLCCTTIRFTRFKDKVNSVVHILNISLLSRSFILHASVNILKFKFYLHTIHCIAPSVVTYWQSCM